MPRRVAMSLRMSDLSRYVPSVCTAAILLSGCGGLAQSPTPTTQTPLGNAAPSAHTVGRRQSLSPTPSFSCLTSACIYVATGNIRHKIYKVAIYPANATGNVPPVELITGVRTRLKSVPAGVAVDAGYNVYATQANHKEHDIDDVSVYGAGAYGNAAPIQTIKGKNTGLYGPLGVAVDAFANIYVVNFAIPSVTVYAAGANGNVSPIQTISGSNTGLSLPFRIALDGRTNIYVTNQYPYKPGFVTVYAAGANGNVSPIQTISGSNTGLSIPTGIAVDASGNIYVANGDNNSVTVYSAGANGNVSPIRTIIGSKTKLHVPLDLALDVSGNIYVANGDSNTVTVYSAGANGNLKPIQIIKGSKTGLDQISGFAVR
jgi:hypothetical protein